MKTRLTSAFCLFIEVAAKLARTASLCMHTLMDAAFPRRKSGEKWRSPAKTVSMLEIARGLNANRIVRPSPFAFLHESTHSFLPYSDETIKSLVWDFKYRLPDRGGAACFFSDIMSDELISFLSDTLGNNPLSTPALLVYCPSSSFASGKKEWDQMKELALLVEKQTVSFQPYLNVCINAIEVRDTKEQHTGTRKERLLWSKGKYRVSENFKKYIDLSRNSGRNVHIICIDDILTTGATLQAAFAAVTDAFNDANSCNTHAPYSLSAFTLCFTEAKNSGKKIASNLKI